LNSQEELNQLFPFHIWTEHFTEERLRWKRDKPLHVLVLRVYKLDEPLEIPLLAEYNGCKSWIHLDIQLSEGIGMNPVMSEAEFIADHLRIAEIMS
jgi:hypothetical protein